jgi:hypothetical protein
MATTQHKSDQERSRRPRLWRFSLRTLLILLTLLCVWLGFQVHRVRHQKKVVAAVLGLGGRIRYDGQPSDFEEDERRVQEEMAAKMGRPRPTFVDEPIGPPWLRKLIGDEYFQQIAEIVLVGTNVYTDRVEIRDEMLDYITSVRNLEGLTLVTTDLSDGDLARIGNLAELRNLSIRNAPITDAGLEHLRSLHNLWHLSVMETDVTEEGVRSLQEYLPNCTIAFSAWSYWKKQRETH